jgi:hypothetical protein
MRRFLTPIFQTHHVIALVQLVAALQQNFERLRHTKEQHSRLLSRAIIFPGERKSERWTGPTGQNSDLIAKYANALYLHSKNVNSSIIIIISITSSTCRGAHGS